MLSRNRNMGCALWSELVRLPLCSGEELFHDFLRLSTACWALYEPCLAVQSMVSSPIGRMLPSEYRDQVFLAMSQLSKMPG